MNTLIGRSLISCALAGIACLPALAQQTAPQEKPSTTRTLKLKLNYTGAGTVDEKHKIHVFLFDSPDFVSGAQIMPIGAQSASAKDEILTFSVDVSPVYAVVAFDPSGEYDGQSGPPPSGASVSMYSKEPGKPEPVKIEAGKTVEIEITFDDSFKMP